MTKGFSHVTLPKTKSEKDIEIARDMKTLTVFLGRAIGIINR
jgi:hypothetical protein